MIALTLSLAAISFVIAIPAALAARALGRRLNALDAPGVAGQVKAPPRRVPNTGGIAVFAAIAGPMLVVLCSAELGWFGALAQIMPELIVSELSVHVAGLSAISVKGFVLLGGVFLLHILGVVDDRRPLPAIPKLLAIIGVAIAVVWFTDTRLLTLFDPLVGGPWLSILATILWIGVITNAFNFLDNMDGLSAGVALICAAFFLATAMLVPERPQWFVAGLLAMLCGALAGFLVFNFPWQPYSGPRDHTSSAVAVERKRPGGASLFLGDGGSLVIGFLLAFASVRLTYTSGGQATQVAGLSSSYWHSLLIPLVILAVPLYDFCSVCAIRISQGRSPFVGDLQHFSHRLVNHGLSRRAAVLVIYGCTAVTGIGAISLPSLAPWQAALVGVQTLLVLAVLALYEWARTP